MEIQLKKELTQVLEDLHWLPLKPVQEKTIPLFLAGRNLLVQAETGAGKTAAYLLPLLQQTEPFRDENRALIIAPTRELAMQIRETADTLSSYLPLHTALLIGGVALVVLAVKEWIETGELGEEACLSLVVGITAIGGAISLLVGGPLALIIASLVAFAIAAVTNGDKIKDALDGVLGWIKGFFLRDWREVFGNTLGSILNFFSEKVVGFVEKQINALKGLIDFVQGVFTGNWKQAWQGICDFVKNLVPDALKKAFNKVVELWNKVASKISAALKFEIKPLKIGDTQIFGGGKVTLGKVPSIPYLAKGAVIPPNAPFLAMLGDQKHGTNIEAPLATIEAAVERVMSRYSGMADERIVVLLSQILEAVLGIEIDGATLSKAIDNYRRKEAVMRGG
jgi:hypothetical protein